MKHLLYLLILTLTGITSCKKLQEQRIIFTGTEVEIDAAVLNAVASGRTYPILTRLPAYGRPVITTSSTSTGVVADPTITRTSGQIKLRVNLVGAQTAADRSIPFNVVATEKDATGADLVVTTAVEGTHFTIASKTIVVPANSSFGDITINVLNAGASTTTRDIVLELTDGNLKASANYKKIGIRIAQN